MPVRIVDGLAGRRAAMPCHRSVLRGGSFLRLATPGAAGQFTAGRPILKAVEWNVESASVRGPEASAELLAYYTEIVGRYHGRPARDEEVESAMADDPGDDLTDPTGCFLLASHHEQPAGCAGLRLMAPEVVELTRVFVRPERRGTGGGAALLAAAERAARSLGASVIRLDTRKDLVEARALYTRHGYREIPAYSQGPYSDHWFEERLD